MSRRSRKSNRSRKLKKYEVSHACTYMNIVESLAFKIGILKLNPSRLPLDCSIHFIPPNYTNCQYRLKDFQR